MIVGCKKLHLPWIGPYYVREKLSQLNVKLRRISDNKPMKNRIHIERLKSAYFSRDTNDLTFDVTPPSHADSLPPAVEDESELPLNLINGNSAEASTQNNAECPQAEANNIKAIQANTIDDSTSDYFNLHTDANIDITQSDQSNVQDTQKQKY